MKCWDCRKDIGEDRLRCDECAKKPVEFKDEKSPGSWTRRTNVERELYKKDILQPFKRDGTVNEHFRQVYGDRAYKKELKGIKRV